MEGSTCWGECRHGSLDKWIEVVSIQHGSWLAATPHGINIKLEDGRWFSLLLGPHTTTRKRAMSGVQHCCVHRDDICAPRYQMHTKTMNGKRATVAIGSRSYNVFRRVLPSGTKYIPLCRLLALLCILRKGPDWLHAQIAQPSDWEELRNIATWYIHTNK